MVFAALRLRFHNQLNNPTVLVVVDRIDLDAQIGGTFTASNVPNTVGTDSRAELQQLLKDDTRKVILTTIHKFGESGGVLNDRDDIIVFVDEAHRIANLDSVKTMLKEGRMFGAAVFLSTQEAHDLGKSIYANSGTITCFQLNEPRDSRKIAEVFTSTNKAVKLADQIRNLKSYHALFRNSHYSPYVHHKVLSLDDR